MTEKLLDNRDVTQDYETRVRTWWDSLDDSSKDKWRHEMSSHSTSSDEDVIGFLVMLMESGSFTIE